MLLNQKYQSAREQQISMTMTMNNLSELSLSEEDIVTLLANLLDNAIEACLKLHGDRRIQLKMVIGRGGAFPFDPQSRGVGGGENQRQDSSSGKGEIRGAWAGPWQCGCRDTKNRGRSTAMPGGLVLFYRCHFAAAALKPGRSQRCRLLLFLLSGRRFVPPVLIKRVLTNTMRKRNRSWSISHGQEDIMKQKARHFTAACLIISIAVSAAACGQSGPLNQNRLRRPAYLPLRRCILK